MMQRMDQIHAARQEALQPLAEILETRMELMSQFAATAQPYNKAYADAVAAGWSAEELTAIGAEEPSARPKGRPPKRAAKKRTAKNTAAGAESPTSSSTSAGETSSGNPSEGAEETARAAVPAQRENSPADITAADTSLPH